MPLPHAWSIVGRKLFLLDTTPRRVLHAPVPHREAVVPNLGTQVRISTPNSRRRPFVVGS